MALNFFGSSKTTSDTNTTIDNSYRDESVNTNNAGAIQSGGGDITLTDGGAMKAAVELGEGAYGLSSDLVKNALKSNQSAMDLSLQTATGAIDHSLAIAGEATRSESKELMRTLSKVGIALAVVFAIGMAVSGRNK